MRIVLVSVTALVMTLILGPTVMIARLLGAPQGPRSIYSRAIRLWARTMNAAAGVQVRVHGAEHLYHEHGAVFVANHLSWFDVFALAAEVPWCSFVAKTELKKVPVFGFAIQCAGIVFIDRENRKAAFKSYEQAAKEVQRGRAVVVYPEGTRGRDYHLRPFKKGPFVLAIASQAPIVPTVVYGARDVMPKGSFWIKSGPIDLHFLAPVPTTGCAYEDRDDLMLRSWTAMADTLRDTYGVSTKESPVANEA